MTAQEINLYHPIFRRQPKRFSALAMLEAVAVVLVAGLGLYAFDVWQMRHMQTEMARAQQAQRRADGQLARALPVFGLAPLKARIARLDKEATALERLQKILLQSHKAAQGDGPVLVAVSHSVVPGLWIESLRYDRGQRLLVIRGHSERPSAVPVFLRNMAEQKLWAHITFQGLRVDRRRHGQGYVPYVAFVASTKALGPTP